MKKKNVNNSELWNTKNTKDWPRWTWTLEKNPWTKFVQCTIYHVRFCIIMCNLYCLLFFLLRSSFNPQFCSFVFFTLLILLFFLSLCYMNLWIFCKIRSTSLILPNLIFFYWTLVPLCDIFTSQFLLSLSTYFPTRGGILCLYNACKCIYRKLYHLMFPFHHHCFGHHSILSVSHARSDIPSLTTLMPHYPS